MITAMWQACHVGTPTGSCQGVHHGLVRAQIVEVPRTWRLFGEVHAFLFQDRMIIAVCLALHLGAPG